MDYVYGTLSNTDGEDPLDFDALMANPAEYFAVACNVETGEPVYLDKSCITRDHYDVCKASCALPVACHPYEAGGVLCLDGGMVDPVPIQKAFDDGCDKVVLILTKPRDTVPSGQGRRHLCQAAAPALSQGRRPAGPALQEVQRRRGAGQRV